MTQGTNYRVERKGFNMVSVFPDASMVDLYDNGKQNFDIGREGASPLALYNFKFVDPEEFGGGKLIGAEVDLYLNSINSGWNGTNISGLKVYKNNDVITQEGGSNGISCIGKEGGNIYSNTAYMNTNTAFGETFEQTKFSKRQNGYIIGNTTVGTDPYLTLNVAYQNGTRYGELQSKSSKKRSKEAFAAGIGEEGGQRLFVEYSVKGETTTNAIGDYNDVRVPLDGVPNHFTAQDGGFGVDFHQWSEKVDHSGIGVGIHQPGVEFYSIHMMPSMGFDHNEIFMVSDCGKDIKYANQIETIPAETHMANVEVPMSTSNTWWDEIRTYDNTYAREPITTTMTGMFGTTPEHAGGIAKQTSANIYPYKFGGTSSPVSMCFDAYYAAPHTADDSIITYGSMLFDSKNPLSQEILAVKSKIPAPISLQSREKSGLSSSTPADTALNTSVVAPTIEIEMNIAQLSEVFRQEAWQDDTSGSLDNQSDNEIRLNRFIAISLSERAPLPDESFYDFYKDHGDNSKDMFGTFIYQKNSKTFMHDFNQVSGTFDTHHKEICVLESSSAIIPSTEDGTDLTGRWFTIQYECAPHRTATTHDGKLVRTVVDPTTGTLLSPVRMLTSFSSATDLTNNWPSHLSIWVVNTPPCGGRASSDVEFGNSCLDSSFVLAQDMTGTTVDAEDEIQIKKRVRSDAYSYEDVDGQGASDAFHFRVGEQVKIGTETLTVMERFETSTAVSGGEAAGTGNFSYLTLKRGTNGSHNMNDRIWRLKSNKSDVQQQNKSGSKIKVYVDSIKLTGFNHGFVNSTNNTSKPIDDMITVLPESELVTRAAKDVTVQTKTTDSTEWTGGSLDTNPLYEISNQYLSFGFQTLANLDDATDKYLFFNGFEYGNAENAGSIDSTPWSNFSRISSVRAGYSDGAVTNGGQYKNEVFMNKSAVRSTTMRGLIISSDNAALGGSTSYTNIITTTDNSGTASNNANFNDFFLKNGITKVRSNLWDTTISGSAQYLCCKRENIFSSARILEIIDEKTIRVDTSLPLIGKSDEDYIIYKYGAAYATSSRRSVVRTGTGSDPDASNNSLRASSIQGNIIKFPAPILLADNGTTELLTAANLPLLMISPRRAWLIFEINDGTQEERGRLRMSPRKYESVVQIIKDGDSNLPIVGPTFNETLYTDAFPQTSSVNRSIFDPVLSTLELKTNYGFGAMSDSDGGTDSVGHLGILPLNSSHVGKYNTLDISGLVKVDSHQEADEIGLFYTPSSAAQSGLLNFDSEDGTNPPKHWSVFFDELPSVTSFKVNPEKTNSFNPRYEWEMDADDAWYGILIASDRMIPSQYHTSVAHIPLNENVTTYGGVYSNDTAATAGTFTNYKGGLAGYSKVFNGSSNYIKFGHAALSTKPTNKMAVVAHIIPDDTPSGDEYILFKDDGAGASVSARNEFSIYINSSGQVGAKVLSGSTTHTLLSNSIIATDGKIPTNIILTIDGTIKSENVKLFINGNLEDSTGARKTIGTANNWQTSATIGASGVSNNDLYIGAATTDGSARANFFDGSIEEIVIYNDVIYPVSPELGFFTLEKPFKEQNNGSIRPITARLFIKDYHNIRGSSSSKVAASSMVSFSKPSFNLYG